MLAGLVLLPLSPNLLVATLALVMCFVGTYLYHPPYRALYADLLPRGLYVRSLASQAVLRGAGGVVIGPLAVGYAVRFSGGLFPETAGYAAMWMVIGVATLLAVPLLRRISVQR